MTRRLLQRTHLHQGRTEISLHLTLLSADGVGKAYYEVTCEGRPQGRVWLFSPASASMWSQTLQSAMDLHEEVVSLMRPLPVVLPPTDILWEELETDGSLRPKE